MIVLLAVVAMIPLVTKSRPRGHGADPAAFVVKTGAVVTVSISGEVSHAGIYQVAANTLTLAAINLAQPFSPLDHASFTSFATQQVRDGAAFQVIRRSAGSTSLLVGSIPSSQRMLLGIPLDINEMDVEDFDRLPGIGPTLARRIVDCRQLNGGKLYPADLLSIEGIGEKKFRQIRKFF